MGYFDKWPEKKVIGIPNVVMNAPVYQGTGPAGGGDVGIELEIEASNYMPETKDILVRDEKTGGYWEHKPDGSLRGGLEYVSSVPFSIEAVPTMVGGFFEAIQKHKTKLRLSNRCSTHVHLNVSDWKIDKVTSLFVLWTLFEGPLVNWCGVERKTNHFCLTTKDSDDNLRNWYKYLSSGLLEFHEGSKYTSMNLLPIWTQGSVEVRIGRAPSCANDVTPWVQFLWALRSYAGALKSPSILPILVSGDGPSGLFSEICDSVGLQEFKEEVFAETEDFDRVCYESFRECQKLCYFPWDDWLPLIEKTYLRNPFTSKPKPAPNPARGIFEAGVVRRGAPAHRILHQGIEIDQDAINQILNRPN